MITVYKTFSTLALQLTASLIIPVKNVKKMKMFKSWTYYILELIQLEKHLVQVW